jgi:solute carrier family 45, member 1/2/4
MSLASWTGQPAIKGSSESLRMMLLTESLIGIQYVLEASSCPNTLNPNNATERVALLLTRQLCARRFTWGVEMTYCTPYLLELGLAKSTVSLVWIAGPLSGLVMQPVVGVVADRSRSRWGRRRPFMVGGAAVVCGALLVLGWTKEIVGLVFGGAAGAKWQREAAVVLAVGCIYTIDFAINAVQASARSLVVDTLPIAKQQLGSAWASRTIAVGSLVSFGIEDGELRRGPWADAKGRLATRLARSI